MPAAPQADAPEIDGWDEGASALPPAGREEPGGTAAGPAADVDAAHALAQRQAGLIAGRRETLQAGGGGASDAGRARSTPQARRARSVGEQRGAGSREPVALRRSPRKRPAAAPADPYATRADPYAFPGGDDGDDDEEQEQGQGVGDARRGGRGGAASRASKRPRRR